MKNHSVMFRLIIAFTSILVFSLSSCAVGRAGYVGSNQFKDRYQAYLPVDEVLLSGDYQSTLSKKGDHYVFRTFFPETKQLTHQVHYSDAGLTTKDGPYKEWYDDGQLMEEGQFSENLRVGQWNSYHVNGNLSSTGEYVDGQRSGEWTYYHSGKNISSTGSYEEGQKTGVWKSYYSNGRIRDEINYTDGERDGIMQRFDSLGTSEENKFYRAGEPVNSDGIPLTEDNISEEMPSYPGCESVKEDEEAYRSCSQRKLLEFIYSNVKYPARAREYSVQGQAIVSFVVEKDGSIADVFVVRGISQDIRAEVLRIVGMMEKWHPGKMDGEPVRVKFNLPVNFKLE